MCDSVMIYKLKCMRQDGLTVCTVGTIDTAYGLIRSP